MSASCALVRLDTPAERCTKKAEGSRKTGVAIRPASFSLIGQRTRDAGQHFLVGADRRDAAARTDARRDDHVGIRMIGRVGGAKRPQQVDPVAGPDDRQVSRLGHWRQAHGGKRSGQQQAHGDGAYGSSRICD